MLIILENPNSINIVQINLISKFITYKTIIKTSLFYFNFKSTNMTTNFHNMYLPKISN